MRHSPFDTAAIRCVAGGAPGTLATCGAPAPAPPPAVLWPRPQAATTSAATAVDAMSDRLVMVMSVCRDEGAAPAGSATGDPTPAARRQTGPGRRPRKSGWPGSTSADRRAVDPRAV